MSATHGAADPLGRYYTPDALARAIVGLDAVQDFVAAAEHGPVCVLEPHGGGGAFVRRLLDVFGPFGLTVMDIDPAAPCLTERGSWGDIGDFLQHRDRYDLIIGNPPFSDAERHVRHALSLLRPGGRLVFLLRLAFLAGQARGDGLWREAQPSEVHVLSRRPSFTGGGTDSADYAVIVWEEGWTRGERGDAVLRWLRW